MCLWTNLSDPIRILLKKPFKRLELLQHSPNTVEAVTADNDLDPSIRPADLVHILLHLLIRHCRSHLCNIHSNRIRRQRAVGAKRVNTGKVSCVVILFAVAEYPLTTGDEMFFISVRLEADDIGAEHALEELLPPGEDFKDFRGWPGSVNE